MAGATVGDGWLVLPKRNCRWVVKRVGGKVLKQFRTRIVDRQTCEDRREDRRGANICENQRRSDWCWDSWEYVRKGGRVFPTGRVEG